MFETAFDRRALAEVYNILKLLEKSKFDKIPQNLIDAIRYNMDFKYEFNYSNLEKNQLLDDTKKILSVIYIDYLASYEERDTIYKMENLKYINNDNIFQNFKNNESNTLNGNNNKNLILIEEIKKETFIQKIIKKIKNWIEKRK